MAAPATVDRVQAELPERDHLPGCPRDRTRTEQYQDRRPAKPDQGLPAVPVTVTRCTDCGGHSVKETAR